jgi:hypothetical protein
MPTPVPKGHPVQGTTINFSESLQKFQVSGQKRAQIQMHSITVYFFQEDKMTSFRKSVWTGSAALALIACAGLALAQSPALHHMIVALPNGGTAQIAYSGDVAPKVSFESDPFWAAASSAVPFSTFERLSAAMDQEMNAAMNEASFWDMPMPTPAQIQADLRNDPRGLFCMESISVTRTSPQAAPKVVSHQYGNCAPLDRAAFGVKPEHAEKNSHTIQVQTPGKPKSAISPSLIEAAYQPR